MDKFTLAQRSLSNEEQARLMSLPLAERKRLKRVFDQGGRKALVAALASTAHDEQLPNFEVVRPDDPRSPSFGYVSPEPAPQEVKAEPKKVEQGQAALEDENSRLWQALDRLAIKYEAQLAAKETELGGVQARLSCAEERLRLADARGESCSCMCHRIENARHTFGSCPSTVAGRRCVGGVLE